MRAGWRRWLAGILLAGGGLGALPDLAAPDDPLAAVEARLPDLALEMLQGMPLYPEAALESRWRAATRGAHRWRENLRTLAVSIGAMVLAWGVILRRRWAAPLLAWGLGIWTALYALDLFEAHRLLGHLPFLFAWGQGLNLLFLLGLWIWLRRDDRITS